MAQAPDLTLDQLASAARRDPKSGLPALVSAMRDDPELMKQVHARLAHYAEMENAPGGNRLDGCWISRTTRSTLLAALATANQEPGVPAGDASV